jgi:hypothetical protein
MGSDHSTATVQILESNACVKVDYNWGPKSYSSKLDITSCGPSSGLQFQIIDKTSAKIIISGFGSKSLNSSPKTLREKLLDIATLPEVVHPDGTTEESKPISDLLPALRYATTHAKIKTKQPNPHDVGADVREEAAALVEWMDANPNHVAAFEQSEQSRLVPELKCLSSEL